MPRRSDARKCVVQMLYVADQNPDVDIHWVRENIEERLTDDAQLVDFAWRMFTGVREQQDSIDERITKVAANWRVDRMAPTDRNVLRLGIFEMEIMQTPAAVVLNECIELAREFGSENSPSFVNGILDKFAASDTTPSTDAEASPS